MKESWLHIIVTWGSRCGVTGSGVVRVCSSGVVVVDTATERERYKKSDVTATVPAEKRG